MKVQGIEAIAIDVPLKRNFGGATYSVLKRSTVVTRLRTDEGLVSEVYNGDNREHGPEIVRLIEHELAPRVKGLDILEVERAWQAMFELTQYALRTPALAEFPAAQYGVYRGLAARLLQAGAARYRVRWDIPIADLAALGVALTDGATLAWLATRDDEAAERLLDVAADAITAHARPITQEIP